MPKIIIPSQRPKEVIDITDEIRKIINTNGSLNGLCHLFITHTTAALTTADLDPGTDVDMLEAYTEMIPKLQFRHLHDPSHAPDHILSALIGSDVTIPIESGKLVLGTWQRIIMIEFNGPRERTIYATLISP
jgi:secondary thiamine-phosphate synthase enzyme